MKFAVYTKWCWENVVPTPAELQANMNKAVSGDTTAEDVIWWKIDENHHQSLIIYPSEKIAEEDLAKRQVKREKSSADNNIVLVEEFMGPIMSRLTELQRLLLFFPQKYCPIM